jgi:hypothetical protein
MRSESWIHEIPFKSESIEYLARVCINTYILSIHHSRRDISISHALGASLLICLLPHLDLKGGEGGEEAKCSLTKTAIEQGGREASRSGRRAGHCKE